MDIGQLKRNIDIRSEFESYRKQYEFKKREIKRAEIKKIFKGFKNFFKKESGFKFKENEQRLTAEYKDYCVTLDVDTYKNIDSKDFYIEGLIKTYQKESYEFYAEATSNKPVAIIDAQEYSEERMVYDTSFFKQFLDDTVVFNFRYHIKGRSDVYNDMESLMDGL